IHLTRNLIQRWMGLATVAIQTASGSSGPEMSIEGIPQAEALRDFLYSKMRGARGLNDTSAVSDVATDGSSADESLQLLREIRDTLKRQTTARADTSSEGTTS
ncbi:MAG: PH domain-containing protein, partial [Pirellulaceae bacterium]|nr:PH domain-containing protein [Pirellulaceae bacterium]